MSIKLRWLGCVCFEVVLPSGKVLVTDPFIDHSPTAPVGYQEVSGADYIVITHGHFDHVADLGPLARKFNSKVICSHQVVEPLAKFFDLDPGNLIRVTAGATIAFEDLRVEVMRGEHNSPVPLLRLRYKQMTGKRAEPGMSLSELQKAVPPNQGLDPGVVEIKKNMEAAGIVGGEQLNFVLQTPDNLRLCLYSSGPYEFLRHEVTQAHPNVFLAHLGAVNPAKVAEIAALSGAEVVIPIHHDGAGAEAMHNVAQEMAQHLATRSRASFLDITHGKWYEIGLKASPIQ